MNVYLSECLLNLEDHLKFTELNLSEELLSSIERSGLKRQPNSRSDYSFSFRRPRCHWSAQTGPGKQLPLFADVGKD